MAVDSTEGKAGQPTSKPTTKPGEPKPETVDFTSTGQPVSVPDTYADFSVESMRVDPALSVVATTTIRTGMFCGKPHKQQWFRVSSDPAHHITVRLLELITGEDKSELYAFTGSAMSYSDAGFTATLSLSVYKDNSPFLLLAKEPVGEKWDTWYHSLAEVREIAKARWVRLTSDRHSGTYSPVFPQNEFPAPKFPAMTMAEALYLCFKGGRLIKDANHPALRALTGAE